MRDTIEAATRNSIKDFIQDPLKNNAEVRKGVVL